jgi:hypothetical protein
MSLILGARAPMIWPNTVVLIDEGLADLFVVK